MRQTDSLLNHFRKDVWVIRVPDLQVLEVQARDRDVIAHRQPYSSPQMPRTPPPSPQPPCPPPPTPSRSNNNPQQHPYTPNTRPAKTLAQTIAEDWGRESKDAKEKWRLADTRIRDQASRESTQRRRKAKM